MSYQGGYVAGQNGYVPGYRPQAPPVYDESNSGNGNQNSLRDVVDSIEFGDEEKELMDEIDKLREAGVDQLVELPQIVVVGDQSAGKSSVLEAVTEVDFPRASTKCTRFATQIKLRHSTDKSFSARIIPDPSCNPVEAQRLANAQFPESFPEDTPFREIFNRATDAICPQDTPAFWSKHVLSVEVSGLNLPHLTIVDLPGFIHAATGSVGQNSVDAIMDTAFKYMENRRSIILAVISAASDPELQTVLGDKARRFDPSGERTIGVITKPDKVETKEEEEQFLALARNKIPSHKLKLGWHVLRNRTPEENMMRIPTLERNEREMAYLLGHAAWKQLGQESLGVASLKTKLSLQLVKHISKEMPMVHKEILTKLEDYKIRLSKLGKRRDTAEGMRDQLRNFLEESQKLAKTAIDGQYIDLHGSRFFHEDESRKLRARIVLANEAFSRTMLEWGHSVELRDDRTTLERRQNPRDPSVWQEIMARSIYLKEKIGPFLEGSPGLELSMDRNPLLVFNMFRSYSENWPTLTSTYIREVYGICVEFLHDVINTVWPDDMTGRVWTHFVGGDIEDRLADAEAEAAHLFRDRTRMAKTYDLDHERRVNEWLANRQFASNPDGSPGSAIPLLTNAEIFLQKMLVYYDLTLRTYMSNVIVQCVERHLVDGFEDIFRTSLVMDMDKEEIIEVAQEDNWIRQERKELERNQHILETGERVCRQNMGRSGMKLEDILRLDRSIPSGDQSHSGQSRSYTNTRRTSGWGEGLAAQSQTYNSRQETSSQGTASNTIYTPISRANTSAGYSGGISLSETPAEASLGGDANSIVTTSSHPHNNDERRRLRRRDKDTGSRHLGSRRNLHWRPFRRFEEDPE